MVRDHLKASAELAEKVLRTKGGARAFLIRAGILSKDGKGLAPLLPLIKVSVRHTPFVHPRFSRV